MAIRDLGAPFSLLLLSSAPLAQCEIAQLHLSDSMPGDLAGFHVALDGELAVVGKPRKVSTAPDFDAAYVFRRAGSSWIETDKLVPSDFLSGQDFGDKVAVRDGTVIVSDPGGFGAAFFTGKAYVFEDLGSGYVETQTLEALDGAFSDQFGFSLAMSPDGQRAVVGAPFRTTGQNGVAYVFAKTPGGWVQEAKLLPSGGSDPSVFGIDVDIDGDVIAVGDWKDDLAGPDAGAAYVFEHDGAGWVQTARLQGHDTNSSDTYGTSVAVSGDRIVVGSSNAGGIGPFGTGPGRVYVYERQAGSWKETDDLVPAVVAAGMEFGLDVDLDGDRLVIGARSAGFFQGAAYYFEKRAGGWVEVSEITIDSVSFLASYGTAVAIDGPQAAVGGPRQANPAGGSGVAAMWSVGDGAALVGGPATLSVSQGGVHELFLRTCPPRPGLPYLVLGSLTPLSMGIPIDQHLLPLEIDAYFLYTLEHPNSPPLGSSFGMLSGEGTATATFTVPAGFAAGAGLMVAHAFVVIELLPGLLHLPEVSGRVELELVP